MLLVCGAATCLGVGEGQHESVLLHGAIATAAYGAYVAVQLKGLDELELGLVELALVERDAVHLQLVGAERDQVVLVGAYEVTVEGVVDARRRVHRLVEGVHLLANEETVKSLYKH